MKARKYKDTFNSLKSFYDIIKKNIDTHQFPDPMIQTDTFSALIFTFFSKISSVKITTSWFGYQYYAYWFPVISNYSYSKLGVPK